MGQKVQNAKVDESSKTRVESLNRYTVRLKHDNIHSEQKFSERQFCWKR